MILEIILFVIGGWMALEGSVVLIFPSIAGKKLNKKSSVKRLRKGSLMELIVGIALVVVGTII